MVLVGSPSGRVGPAGFNFARRPPGSNPWGFLVPAAEDRCGLLSLRMYGILTLSIAFQGRLASGLLTLIDTNSIFSYDCDL